MRAAVDTSFPHAVHWSLGPVNSACARTESPPRRRARTPSLAARTSTWKSPTPLLSPRSELSVFFYRLRKSIRTAAWYSLPLPECTLGTGKSKAVQRKVTLYRDLLMKASDRLGQLSGVTRQQGSSISDVTVRFRH